jgi:hypothetical protein
MIFEINYKLKDEIKTNWVQQTKNVRDNQLIEKLRCLMRKLAIKCIRGWRE